MSNLNKLRKLIDEGKYLDEHKISRETEEISRTTFDYHRTTKVLDVDKEKYREWDKKVISFLENLHLQEFIEPKGLYNDFQEEYKGNCINFTPQYEKLQNLYRLCNILANKKLAIPTNAEKIKKDFLLVSSYKDVKLLDTYQIFIGRDPFREIYENLREQQFLNFNIHFGSGTSFSLRGDEFLTLKGKAELKKIKSWWRCINWKKWIVIILSLIIGGEAINFIVEYNKQNAAINVSGSNNTVILQQNQDNK